MLSRTSSRLSHTVWRWGSAGSSPLQTQHTLELTKKPAPVPGLTKVAGEVASMSSGLEHSGVVVNGKVMTFGSNKYAQLGRNIEGKGEFIDAVARYVEAGPSPIASIACGGWHSINLHADKSVSSFGWGGSFFMGAGALGLGSKRAAPKPTIIDMSGEKVVQVACGNQHSLFLTESGKLYATGHGAYGILGTGDTSDELLPVEISSLEATLLPEEKVVKISCGASFSAFITNLGNLYLWGRNDSGQLGLGEESQGDMHSAERYPRRIAFFESERTFIKDIACGENHLVALAQNGALYYWGDRTWLEPHLVSLPEANGGLKGIVKISAGTKCSFALTESGILYTWGFKNSGCLVLDDLKGNLLTPTAIPPSFFGYEKVVDISASRQRCIAATSDEEYIATSPEEAEIVKKMFGKDSDHKS